MKEPLKPRRAQVSGRIVQGWRLSRTAKVRPEYQPTFREEYHSREAANYAGKLYEETGIWLLHDEAKRAIARIKKSAKPAEPATQSTSPKRRPFQHQDEFRLSH